jgi:hypothetical protein
LSSPAVSDPNTPVDVNAYREICSGAGKELPHSVHVVSPADPQDDLATRMAALKLPMRPLNIG